MKAIKLKKMMLVVFASYVLIRILRETMFFVENDTALRLLNYIKFGLAGLSAVKVLLDFVNHKLNLKKILIMGVGALFLCMVVYFTKIEEILIFWVLISAAHDINHKELCRVVGIVMLAVVVLAFICSKFGIIENTVNYRWYLNSPDYRSGCGFEKQYMASHNCFFGVVAYLYSRSQKISWIEIVLLITLQVAVYVFAKTKNPFVIGIFCTVLVALNKLGVFNGMAEFFSKKKVLSWLGASVILLCATIPFVLISKYSAENEYFVWLNSALGDRLSLGNSAIQTFGSSILGQTIEWSSTEGYNIVDSSFINIYVNYGVIFFALVLFAYALMGYHAGKKKDIAFLIALLAVGMHSMFDCFLLMLYCNPFLMPFSYLGDNPPVLFKDIEDPTVQA